VPALAVGRALVAAGHPQWSIHYEGSRRGHDRRLVPEAGFDVTLLPGRGIARRLTVDNIGAVAGLAAAFVLAFWLLLRRRPAVVVSVGGYASLPCAVAAVVLRIPLVLVAVDAVPGAALRAVARFAAASAVAFPGTPLPRATVTGSPLRPEILAVERTADARRDARAALHLPDDRVVVGVMTGSLGAQRVNEAVVALARRWSGRTDVAIRHAVGRRDWPEMSAGRPDLPSGGLCYQPVEYEDRMDLLYAAADVMVCRAGGSTVAELAAIGVPAIVVPLPNSPGDHQTGNGRALERAGGAVLVPDADLTVDRLERELDALVGDRARLAEMAAAAASAGRRDAADAIARLVERHASGAQR
jgi:UDP-N-acetylglucosamine--N-acetylmuramyl-(pentapeptide) pyrophosphoryl-undecaprenol N-acetylglucosamine transferase